MTSLCLFICSCASTPQPKQDTTAAPDLNGLWQAVGTAHWNLEGGSAIKGPTTGIIGALGGIPAGHSYIVEGSIPYTETAKTQRQTYLQAWHKWDPAVKCFMPGIPLSLIHI